MRGIAGAGFDYSATKRLCSRAEWQLVEDAPDLGFVQYFLWVGPNLDDRRLLSVGTLETDLTKKMGEILRSMTARRSMRRIDACPMVSA
jgi:hypothetical protein